MDNMDGKQARRTGMSSPLGMLFDHGLDALNCIIAAMTFARIMEFSPFEQALSTSLASGVFFMATLEQFFIHEMYLPRINGPNEGLVGVISILLITAVTGPKFWTKEIIGFFTGRSLIILGFIILGTVTIASK